jgi:hypothetical protein
MLEFEGTSRGAVRATAKMPWAWRGSFKKWTSAKAGRARRATADTLSYGGAHTFRPLQRPTTVTRQLRKEKLIGCYVELLPKRYCRKDLGFDQQILSNRESAKAEEAARRKQVSL